MTQERVAIIIPFVQFNAYVEECVDACLRLRHADYIIVLLPDEPLALKPAWSRERIVVVPTGAVNIAAKRNIGISHCAGVTFCAFIDSDAYPHPDWLIHGVQALNRSAAIWAAGGPQLSPAHEDIYQKAVGNAQKTVMVSGIGVFFKKKSRPKYCRKLHSCNVLVKQQALTAVDGFDERFDVGEDQILCHNIVKQGKKIYYDPGIIVYHHNRCLGKHYFLQKFIHGTAVFNVAAFTKNPFDALFLLPLLPGLIVLGLLIGSVLHPPLGRVALVVVCIYMAVVVAEALRISRRVREVPLTLAAILIAAVGYSSGIIAGMARCRFDLRRFYKNYRREEAKGSPIEILVNEKNTSSVAAPKARGTDQSTRF